MSLFSKLFKTDTTKSDNTPAIKFNENELEGFIRYETANRMQTISSHEHWNSSYNPATLDYILSGVLGKYVNYLRSMTIISSEERNKVISVQDSESISEIKSTRLFPLIEPDDNVWRYEKNATIILKFSAEAPSKAVILFLRSIPGNVTGYTKCMRISLLVPVDKYPDDFISGTSGINKTTRVSCVNPIAHSFIVFEDYNEATPLMEEFTKVETSVFAKLEKKETEFTNLEKALLHGWREQLEPADYRDAAFDFAEKQRWFDAYNILKRAFEDAIPIMPTLQGEALEGILRLSQYLGYYLEMMGRIDEAAYFYLLVENNDQNRKEDAFRVLAKLADETVPEDSRTENFINCMNETKLRYRNETSDKYSCNITVGEVLGELFGADNDSLNTLTAIKAGYPTDRVFITENDKVWNYPMRDLLEDDTTVVIGYTPRYSCNTNSFVLRIHVANRDYGMYRINAMQPNFSLDDDKSTEQLETNVPSVISFVMGKGTVRFQNSSDDLYELMNVIRSVLREGRSVEGIHAAKYVYKYLLGRWDQLASDGKFLMLKAAFYLGTCYMGLHLYYKANYYLRLASGAHDPEYLKWYVHSLAMLNDVRTLSIIDICEQMPNVNVEEGELSEFKISLKKHKIHIYVESKRFDEAEQLLNEMNESSDESIKQYVLKELEDIRTLRAQA